MRWVTCLTNYWSVLGTIVAHGSLGLERLAVHEAILFRLVDPGLEPWIEARFVPGRVKGQLRECVEPLHTLDKYKKATFAR